MTLGPTSAMAPGATLEGDTAGGRHERGTGSAGALVAIGAVERQPADAGQRPLRILGVGARPWALTRHGPGSRGTEPFRRPAPSGDGGSATPSMPLTRIVTDRYDQWTEMSVGSGRGGFRATAVRPEGLRRSAPFAAGLRPARREFPAVSGSDRSRAASKDRATDPHSTCRWRGG